MLVKIVRLSDEAVLPTRATEGSSGYDLYLAESEMVMSGRTELLKTDLAIELPLGWEAQIRSRSGLAKRGFVVANSPGTIDSDYRGPIGVLMYNNSPWDQVFMKGERIAQMVIQRVPDVELYEGDSLTETDRGDGGFGSTGS